MNNRGQSIIEATVAMTFFIFAVGGIITVIYLSSLKTWMAHVAFEGSICLAEGNAKHLCETNIRKKINLINFFSYHTVINTIQNKSVAETNITIEFLPKQFLKTNHSLPLPLKTRSL